MMTSQQASPPTAPVIAERPRVRGTAAWALVLMGSVVVCSAYVPVIPAGWRGLTHLSNIGAASPAGKVTVASCSRGALLLDWTCEGAWEVNDREAQRTPPVASMTIENDARFHATGTQVDVSPELGTTHGYLWGRMQQVRVIVLWIGFLLCLLGLGLTAVRWRRRSIAMGVIPLAVGSLIFVAAHPLW